MRIVVAGGGTAGWISAYIIEKAQPGIHDITVIESSAIGIVGAGEGSTGSLYDLVSGFYFNQFDESKIAEFMEFTDSTYKFGINHVGWSPQRPNGYFAPLDGSTTGNMSPDIIFNYVLSKFGTEKAHMASYIGQSYESNKFPGKAAFGFHFDAHKVGKYFRKELERLINVKVIDAKINEVALNQQGEISHLVLDEGSDLHADFFVDCTGFARVLMSKLDVGWKSYQDNLLANRAMPFIVDYTEETKKNAKPFTTAQALSAGWMWDIPLKTRRGCGYVYNSDFISEEHAQIEVEKKLGHPIVPIRHLSFDAGKSKKLWHKNCFASGLSAAFMEPLEATSIHSTIVQMMSFATEYLFETKEQTVNSFSEKSFNNKFEILYDNYRDFLVLHYQGGRKDSDFWKYLSTGKTRTEFVEQIIERSRYHLPSSMQYEHKYGTSTHLWNWILAGLDFVNAKNATSELRLFNQEALAAESYQDLKIQSDYANIGQGKFSISGIVKIN